MHGGTVSATSDGLGKGAEFTVRLPLGKPAAAEARVAAARPVIRPGLRVLVVEDNQDTAQFMSALLRTTGCETQVVYDGISALDAAKAFRPNVMLLDIGLPGLDGFEVAQRVRDDPELAAVKLIAISGYGQEQDQLRSKQAGFDWHFVKPMDFNLLLARLAD
jgi:CheY-like chemotaxis protein